MKIKGLLISAAPGFAFLDRCPELAGKLGHVKVKDSQGNYLSGWIERRGRGLDNICNNYSHNFYTEPSTDGVTIHNDNFRVWERSGDFIFNEPEYEVEFVEFKIVPVEGTAFLDNSPEFYKIVDSPGKKSTMMLADPSPNEPSALCPEWREYEITDSPPERLIHLWKRSLNKTLKFYHSWWNEREMKLMGYSRIN